MKAAFPVESSLDKIGHDISRKLNKPYVNVTCALVCIFIVMPIGTCERFRVNKV